MGTHACSFAVSTKGNKDYTIGPVITYNVEITSFRCYCINVTGSGNLGLMEVHGRNLDFNII